MAAGLRALNRFAASPVIDRLGLRQPAERFLHSASKTTARTAAKRRPDVRRRPEAHPSRPPAPCQDA